MPLKMHKKYLKDLYIPQKIIQKNTLKKDK